MDIPFHIQQMDHTFMEISGSALAHGWIDAQFVSRHNDNIHTCNHGNGPLRVDLEWVNAQVRYIFKTGNEKAFN